MNMVEQGRSGDQKMAIDKKLKDRDKQLEFEFPKEKKLDKDGSNDYNNKARTGKQEKIS